MRGWLSLGVLLLLATAGRGEPGQYEIRDPEWDPYASASPQIRLPNPAVDLTAVTLTSQDGVMRVQYQVSDLRFAQNLPRADEHTFALWFHTETYSLALVHATSLDGGPWSADLLTWSGPTPATWIDLAQPVVDLDASSIEVLVPVNELGGSVLAPRATSHIDWPGFASANFVVGDVAPNEGRGPDYHPRW